jgi:methionine synthase II (cobalamin-independent)
MALPPEEFDDLSHRVPASLRRGIGSWARFERELAEGDDVENYADSAREMGPHDPGNRAAFEAHGHDMAHELVADAEFDSMVFEGLTGVTRAMHMCRGNAPFGMWAGSGGYEAISKEVFPRLENIDRLLLEYDSDRAGGFAPLADVLPHHQVVLGLVTTKDGALESPDDVVARIEEATRYVPLERLAISPSAASRPVKSRDR